MKSMILLMLTMTCLVSADKNKEKYHFSLLNDCPPIFDATGKNVVPKHVIKQKYLLLYFSASWCGPCHQFNPEFIKWYNENGGGKDVEVILVGSDEDTKSIQQYMKDQQMPWLAFAMNGKKFDEIKQKYGGKGIPCVALLDENDNIVEHSYKDGEYQGPRVPLKKYLELTKK